MQTTKAFIAFLTLFAFTLNGIPVVVEAQTAAGSSSATASSSTVPNYLPQGLPTLQGMQSMLGNTVNNCDLQFPVKDATASSVSGTVLNAAQKLAAARAKKNGKGDEASGGICYDPSVKGTSGFGVAAKNASDSSGMGKRALTVATKAKSDSDDSGYNCKMDCPPPTDLKSVGTECRDYFSESDGYQCNLGGKDISGRICSDRSYLKNPDGTTKLASDENRINRFIEFMTWKKTKCSQKNSDEINAQYANYKCKMDALSKAVSDAGTIVQTALAKNNENYGYMMQFQSQVGEQMTQIDEILGPDPSDPNAKNTSNSQFGGLLGVQKALNEKLPAWTASDSSNKTAVIKITSDLAANEQALVANQMSTVSDCLKGNTNLQVASGRSLTCFKPATTTDKDGKSITAVDSSGNAKYTEQACGALEYLRSQITQAPFQGGLKSNSRQQTSQEFGAAFDSMVSGILRDLGGSDPTNKDTGSKVLAVRVSDPQTLLNKYFANMQELSARTGVNVTSQLNIIANSCFTEGKNWVVQQKNSAGSNYNQKLQEINGRSEELSGKMKSDTETMAGEFSSALSVMGGSGSYSCQNSSTIATQQKCFSEIKTKLSDILNGTGSAGLAVKTINGGSMVASFGVSCRGINNCVNTYKSVRTQKKTQLTNAKKATEDFVTKGNNQIQKQLQSFAQGLSALQQQASNQFSNMQLSLLNMGIESNTSPKYTDAKQLETGGSKETGPGPYQMPKTANMAEILSGYVQPAGLMDFKNSGGAQELLAEAKKQSKKDSEAISELLSAYDTSQSKLKSLSSSCINTEHKLADGSSPSKPKERDTNDVNNTDTSKQACQSDYSQCIADPTKTQTNLSTLSFIGNVLKTGVVDASKVGTTRRELASFGDNCGDILTTCNAYMTSLVKGQTRGGSKTGGDDSTALGH